MPPWAGAASTGATPLCAGVALPVSARVGVYGALASVGGARVSVGGIGVAVAWRVGVASDIRVGVAAVSTATGAGMLVTTRVDFGAAAGVGAEVGFGP